MRWSELTWSEIPAVLAAAGNAAILPVGATEQHGPHLGCGVDSVIAEELCAAVAEKDRRAHAAGAALWLLARPQPALAGHHRRATRHADRTGQADRRLGLSQRRAPPVHRQCARDQRRAAALRAGNAARRA